MNSHSVALPVDLMEHSLPAIINRIRDNAALPPWADFGDGIRLREDLGFDSLALAELTVHIEVAYGVDVFAEGLVATLGEIRARLPQ